MKCLPTYGLITLLFWMGFSSPLVGAESDDEQESKIVSNEDQELYKAIRDGNIDTVQGLIGTTDINAHLRAQLEQVPSSDSVAVNPYTPLGLAARYGHSDIVDFLLTQPEIDVNAVFMQTDKSPLFLAAQYEHLACVISLCSFPGILLSKSSKAGLKPIEIAGQKNYSDIVAHLESKKRGKK